MSLKHEQVPRNVGREVLREIFPQMEVYTYHT